jgi:hypothetical protein
MKSVEGIILFQIFPYVFFLEILRWYQDLIEYYYFENQLIATARQTVQIRAVLCRGVQGCDMQLRATM